MLLGAGLLGSAGRCLRHSHRSMRGGWEAETHAQNPRIREFMYCVVENPQNPRSGVYGSAESIFDVLRTAEST